MTDAVPSDKCLIEPLSGGTLDRCAEYPRCICGGPEGDDDTDHDDSPYCECGAVHSMGTEETDCGVCSACGKAI